MNSEGAGIVCYDTANRVIAMGEIKESGNVVSICRQLTMNSDQTRQSGILTKYSIIERISTTQLK